MKYRDKEKDEFWDIMETSAERRKDIDDHRVIRMQEKRKIGDRKRG